ncbi:MAG: efflux RND transporter periplasmic adaptor subunit [Prevotella sp.]|nr:efflux RND transporter periplasmic adaptor subunit [Prevotella sp.]
MIKRILLVAAATLLAVGAFTYFQRPESDGHDHEEHEESDSFDDIPLTQQQVSTAELRMGEVQTRELDATLRVTGTLVLRPQSMADVSSLMGGVVRSILVSEGQRVSKGQVVATVENTGVVTLQREYFTALRESEAARAELTRQQTLAKAGAGVAKNLQQAETAARIADASLTGIGQQLRQMGISPKSVASGSFATVFPLRAPISGTVSRISASIGSYADMQSPLLAIRDNSAMECDLNVFEKDVAKVAVGDRVELLLANQPGRVLRGRVYGVNQYFNDAAKSVAVHVRLDASPRQGLIDGMYVSGTIATGRQKCRALPSQAIVSTEGKSYIFALNGKPRGGKYSFSRHEVTTGVTSDGFTEVDLCEHIRPDSRIVTDNVYYLASLTGEHADEH